ncbi:MAG: hypothetical protein SX243_08490 [Acidobacteriota bacterium]|nr:hypothetical protein [Acidobacteriota bacterium]
MLQATASPHRWLPRFAALVPCLFLALLAACSHPKATADPTPNPQLASIVQQAHAWIEDQRQTHRPEARPLTNEELELYGPYFPEEVLTTARIRTVPRFENPPFLAELRIPAANTLDFRQASGLALIDTILLNESRSSGFSPQFILFHELVHLTQYRHLGPETFLKSWIGDLVVNGRSYTQIRLEAQAFELARRFAGGRGGVFSVEGEVLIEQEAQTTAPEQVEKRSSFPRPQVSLLEASVDRRIERLTLNNDTAIFPIFPLTIKAGSIRPLESIAKY